MFQTLYNFINMLQNLKEAFPPFNNVKLVGQIHKNLNGIFPPMYSCVNVLPNFNMFPT